ncbi:MAG: sugar phosphate isomerase/epimerase [Caldilineaceae bacterium]|nr:sugar phosphate isomerase/epimerase [Caldilineaceae bacterium]
MFPLSFNTQCLRNLPLDRAIEETAKAGYEGIDLAYLAGHLHPFDVTRKELDELKDLFARLPLKPAALSSGGPLLLGDDPFEPSLISPDRKAREKRIDLISAALEMADDLSIPVVQFVSGIRQPGVSAEEATEMLTEGVRACLQNSGEAVLVLEPEAQLPESMGGGRCFIETTTQAVPIIEEISSPRFRLNMDITHVQCCEDDLLQRVADALPYTRHIHIADIKGKVHHHEIPGEGDIDLRSVLEVLKEANYEHYLSIELHSHADEWERALYQGREYMLELMQTLEA